MLKSSNFKKMPMELNILRIDSFLKHKSKFERNRRWLKKFFILRKCLYIVQQTFKIFVREELKLCLAGSLFR